MVDKYGGWSVKDLKIELKNRNEKIIGKREDLIKRLAAHDRNYNFQSNQSSVSEEGSSEFESRLQWPPDNSFTSIQLTSTVPSIDIVHVNNYFLKAYNFEEGMTMFAAVHRKGFNMMQSYFLVALTESKNNEYVFYRAHVHSEMTKTLTYLVKLVLVMDGSIAEASCECIDCLSFTSAACKHVAVVCYALLHFKEQGKLCISNAYTEKNETGHAPKKKRLSSKKAQSMNYSDAEYDDSEQTSNLCYDPRLECYKNMPSYNDDVRNRVINYNSRLKRCLAISGSFSAASQEGIINDHDYLSHPGLKHRKIK